MCPSVQRVEDAHQWRISPHAFPRSFAHPFWLESDPSLHPALSTRSYWTFWSYIRWVCCLIHLSTRVLSPFAALTLSLDLYDRLNRHRPTHHAVPRSHSLRVLKCTACNYDTSTCTLFIVTSQLVHQQLGERQHANGAARAAQEPP